jgi:hypothetical protein
LGRLPPRKKSRNPAVADSDISELVRSIQAEKNYTLAQIAEILRGCLKKRRGRPTRANLFSILDQSAKAMAEQGQYKHLAPRFHLGPKQLANLVQRNRAYFNKKVRAYSQISEL